MKKSNLGLICSIVGGVVMAAATAVALIHFWDDIKRLLPGCCKCKEADEAEAFADLDE